MGLIVARRTHGSLMCLLLKCLGLHYRLGETMTKIDVNLEKQSLPTFINNWIKNARRPQ